MRKLNDYELENTYGGFIATLTALVTVLVIAIAGYKMFTSESAKIKLPGSAEISFSGSKTSAKEPINTPSAITKIIQSKPLKQLIEQDATFTSTPTNFLIKS